MSHELSPPSSKPSKKLRQQLDLGAMSGDIPKFLRIKSGHEPPHPDLIAAAVEYRDYWLWIEHTDADAKRTVAYLGLLMNLAEAGPNGGAQLVLNVGRIPAGAVRARRIAPRFRGWLLGGGRDGGGLAWHGSTDPSSSTCNSSGLCTKFPEATKSSSTMDNERRSAAGEPPN